MCDPIESLIPHRAPMRFIDALTECTETTACATACFDAGHFAVEDGAVLESALIECVAQTAAAALGQRARSSGQAGAPSIGMLVSVSEFRIQSKPRALSRLRIEVRQVKRHGAMFRIAGSISCEGQPVAAGELTLYA